MFFKPGCCRWAKASNRSYSASRPDGRPGQPVDQLADIGCCADHLVGGSQVGKARISRVVARSWRAVSKSLRTCVFFG